MNQDNLKQKVEQTLRAHPMLRKIRRIIISVVGGTVLLLGITLIVLPGPAFIVIPAGLGILAIEYQWSRRWLRKARALIEREQTD
jgi:uncharacterized protein (TIGR02611 family)